MKALFIQLFLCCMMQRLGHHFKLGYLTLGIWWCIHRPPTQSARGQTAQFLALFGVVFFLFFLPWQAKSIANDFYYSPKIKNCVLILIVINFLLILLFNKFIIMFSFTTLKWGHRSLFWICDLITFFFINIVISI